MKNFEHDFTLPPFPAFPSASRYVPLGTVLDAVNRVSRSVLAREAISLIIGPPGTGKSLACAILAKEFAESHDVIVVGETSILDESSFYRFLLHRLGVPFEPGQRNDLELMIHERLCGAAANPNGAVLIVDEAASLTAEVLESIRRLTNLMTNGQPALSAIIAGGVKLDETLTMPSMESFVQRVTARCYLHPMSAQETREYIERSIEACEASAGETITEEAISAIHHAASGVPRLINQLMTEAIDCAAELGQTLIDHTTVDKAWASLQQLPSPMVEEPQIQGQSSVVEFGELSETLPIAESTVAPEEFNSKFVAESISHAEWESDAVQTDAVQADASFDDEEELADPSMENASDSIERTEPVADPIKLFGEFEDEENIEVGAAQVQPVRNYPAEMDLESMLHSQIVSLSQFASENTAEYPASVVGDDTDDVGLGESGLGESEPVEISNDPLSGQDEIVETPGVVWYDEPIAQDTESDLQGGDDSDLLWITEDIDVERRVVDRVVPQQSRRVDQPEDADSPRLKVDYRKMLEKMRNLA